MKLKMAVLGSALTIGVFGSVTAFAATSSNATLGSTTSKTVSAAPHHLKEFATLTSIAKILGVDEATLKSDLQAGQSLAQIAQCKGISEATLISDLKQNLKTKLDKAVQNGKLTATNEQQILSNFDTRAAKWVGNKHPWKAVNGHRRQVVALKDVAKILGIDEATLKSDLQAGQSLAQIAQSKGISEATLISDLKQDMKTRLDKAVQNGKLTAAKEQQILSKFAANATKFVEHQGEFKGKQGNTNDN
jgi:uncharacterized protein YidB (DUF937 family)